MFCLRSSNNSGCNHTRTTTHTPHGDDGDCTSAITCSSCGAITTAAKAHAWDNACDTNCNNSGCNHTRSITHTPNEDDGDCTTAIKCSVCGVETTAAKTHAFTNNCDADCNNSGCNKTRTITHTPKADDGDCTTAIKCSVCEEITTDAKAHAWDNACDTDCNNSGCNHTRTTSHTPNADDGDCTTAIRCSVCQAITTAAKTHAFTSGAYTSDATGHAQKCANCSVYSSIAAHTPNVDAATEETRKYCTVCNYEIEAQLAHTHSFTLEKAEAQYLASEADCTHAAAYYKTCSCGTAGSETFTYGAPNGHTPNADDGDCTTAIKCSVCQEITTAAKAHAWDNACDTDCNNTGCDHTRTITHTPKADDGDCTTAIKCSVCQAITTDAKTHAWNNACDTDCNNTGCNHTRTITHTPKADDGDCTTAIKCSVCEEITTDAKAHAWDNACDTACNNSGCNHTRTTTHKPNADDDNCQTAVKCSVCGAITTAAKTHAFTSGIYTSDATGHAQKCANCSVYSDTAAHTPNVDAATEETRKYCTVCNYEIEAQLAHTHSFTLEKAEAQYLASEADCTNAATYYKSCSCGTKGDETFTVGTPNGHTPNADDGDCTTAIICSTCGAETVTGNESHTGGTATCTEKANCSVCGTAYGELDTENHGKTTFTYTLNAGGETHVKKHECCGAIATAEEAHTYGADDKCVCGAEKPADPETPDEPTDPETPDETPDGEEEGEPTIIEIIFEFLAKIFKSFKDFIIGIFGGKSE